MSRNGGVHDRSDVLAALAAGEIVLLQTDTLPGLHARLDRPAALAALGALKGRPRAKPFLVLAASPAVAQGLTRPWSPPVAAYLRACWPGPVTVVLPAAGHLPPEVAAWPEAAPENGLRTVAVRVPASAALRRLLDESGPLASTSANRAGEPPASDLKTAQLVFPHLPAWGLAPGQGTAAASALVDLSGPQPRLLRPGPVALPDWPGAV